MHPCYLHGVPRSSKLAASTLWPSPIERIDVHNVPQEEQLTPTDSGQGDRLVVRPCAGQRRVVDDRCADEAGDDQFASTGCYDGEWPAVSNRIDGVDYRHVSGRRATASHLHPRRHLDPPPVLLEIHLRLGAAGENRRRQGMRPDRITTSVVYPTTAQDGVLGVSDQVQLGTDEGLALGR